MKEPKFILITFQIGFFLEPIYHTHKVYIAGNKRKKKKKPEWLENKQQKHY